MTAFVYRCRDDKARLIYVGLTRNPVLNRLKQHEREAEWWPLVSSVEWSKYRTFAHAHLTEKVQIHAAHPPFNQLCKLCPRGKRLQDPSTRR